MAQWARHHRTGRRLHGSHPRATDMTFWRSHRPPKTKFKPSEMVWAVRRIPRTRKRCRGHLTSTYSRTYKSSKTMSRGTCMRGSHPRATDMTFRRARMMGRRTRPRQGRENCRDLPDLSTLLPQEDLQSSCPRATDAGIRHFWKVMKERCKSKCTERIMATPHGTGGYTKEDEGW